jgi:hypothetical protein
MAYQRTRVALTLVAGSAFTLATGPIATPADPPADTQPSAPDARAPLSHADPQGDKSGFVDAFNIFYPTSTLTTRMASAAGQDCYVCHQPSSKRARGNCYREALIVNIKQGMSIEQAIAAIDGDDSDNDGTPNGQEILMVRTDVPNEVGYNPGLIGPTGTSPCSTSPTAVISNMPETPPAVCYADCDTSTGVGTLDIFDFLCFQNSFVAGQAYACDCDTSTGAATCDIFDFLCFQNAFVAGCP